MSDKIIAIAAALYILSLMNERIVNWLKLSLHCPDSKLLKWIAKFFTFSKTPGNLRNKEAFANLEKKREKKITNINIVTGSIICLALKADIITMYNNLVTGKNDYSDVFSWKGYSFDLSGIGIWNFLEIFFGCLVTGFFISFGSKFWHDTLDLLLYTKNLKAKLANWDTYNVDNVNALDNKLKTYESEAIQSAYFKIKSQLLAKPNVIATGIKHDEDGYYISITLKADDNSIADSYEYELDNGEIKNVRLKKTITNEDIIAHSFTLSDKIYNIRAKDGWGTLGCLVKKNNNNYLLTCYHNVVEPGSDFKFNANDANTIELENNKSTLQSKVIEALRDYEIDAALISVYANNQNEIINKVQDVGFIKGKRDDIKKSDIANNILVYIYGAADAEKKQGYINGVHCDVSIKYDTANHQLQNLISVSNNGKAIAAGGDSGSPVLDFNNNIIGILVAGDSATSYVIPINSILNKMSLELITT